MNIGRNARCPCGSGKKYKNCCLNSARLATKPTPVAANIPASFRIARRMDDRVLQGPMPARRGPGVCPKCGRIHGEPKWTAEADAVFASMQKESDRGLVIVSGAHLDSELERLLRLRFPKEKLVDGLFERGGPLDSFSAKVKFAFLLGIVSRRCFQDLEFIRRIRNDFAHGTDPVSFTDPNVAARCAEFATTRDVMRQRGARDAYILTIATCQIELAMAECNMFPMSVRE